MTSIDRGILFLHGRESGPHGSKYRTLVNHFGTVESPDFRGLDLKGRIDKAEKITRGKENQILIGSSMGGLLAALLYSNFPERFFGYLLLAPAFHWEETSQIDKAPPYATIIHGVEDEIAPIEASREFSSKWGTSLIEVQDGHRLKNHHILMTLEAKSIEQKRIEMLKGVHV